MDDPLPGALLPIRRMSRSSKHGAREDIWSWRQGGALGQIVAFKLEPDQIYLLNFRNTSEFIKFAMQFSILDDMGVELDREAVKKGTNFAGPFLYTVSSKNNAESECFVFGQGIGAGLDLYDNPPGASTAFVFGFECRDSWAISSSELELSMLGRITTLKYRDLR